MFAHAADGPEPSDAGGELAGDHVAEHVHDLLGVARRGLGRPVDLFQRMVELLVVEGDDRLAERRRSRTGRVRLPPLRAATSSSEIAP
jgi:hypothetical protein